MHYPLQNMMWLQPGFPRRKNSAYPLTWLEDVAALIRYEEFKICSRLGTLHLWVSFAEFSLTLFIKRTYDEHVRRVVSEADSNWTGHWRFGAKVLPAERRSMPCATAMSKGRLTGYWM